MKYLLLIPFTITTFVNATSPFLAPRQESCKTDGKVCGKACIPESYACCPKFSIGCPPGYGCALDFNGDPGCCPIGQVCTNAFGGTTTIAETQPTATADLTTDTADEAPLKTIESEDRQEDDSANDNAGVSNRLDITLGYLVVGAMVLLM
ncbi:hypothetical protein NW768_004199 [Fusarium equiseti]|uniref:Gpi anchored serine-threonine rich protein n=1 Tax=Fusarium equiseti TaxID=61235 RepID=A0ABQ8RJV0_FUSEQ|nr:hypothetical protein NW768_004199 [Fusarium equiseti]